jgi:hypothetical protein
VQTVQASSGEIDRDRWNEFLSDFCKRNENRPTRLEVIGPETGTQELEKFLPLIGMTFEPAGSAVGSIEIILGGLSAEDSRHMQHVILNTKRLMPITGGRDVEGGIGAEAEDGTLTLLTFEELRKLPVL